MTNEIPTSEYLQRQLVEMIELAKHTGTNAVEFVSAQAPDLVHQIIVWEIAKESVHVGSFLLLAIAGAIALIAGIRYGNKNQWAAGAELPLCVFGGFALLLGTIIAVSQVGDLLKPIVAPKVFLMEYASDLIKGRR